MHVEYNASNSLATLRPGQPFTLTKRVQLQVNGLQPSGLEDGAGRLIDGNNDGQPGGNAVAILRKSGVTNNAMLYASREKLAAMRALAIDAVLEREHRIGVGRMRRIKPW
jgi:hypothetical protein